MKRILRRHFFSHAGVLHDPESLWEKTPWENVLSGSLYIYLSWNFMGYVSSVRAIEMCVPKEAGLDPLSPVVCTVAGLSCVVTLSVVLVNFENIVVVVVVSEL